MKTVSLIIICVFLVIFSKECSTVNIVCTTPNTLFASGTSNINLICKKEKKVKNNKVVSGVLIGFLVLISSLFLLLSIGIMLSSFPGVLYVFSISAFILISSTVLFIFIRKLYKKQETLKNQ